MLSKPLRLQQMYQQQESPKTASNTMPWMKQKNLLRLQCVIAEFLQS